MFLPVSHHLVRLGSRATVLQAVVTHGKWQRIVRIARQHGLFPAAHDLGLRAINTVVVFKILRCVAIDRVNPAFTGCPAGYTPMFLTPAMIRDMAKNPDNRLRERVVEEALAKGDECFGIFKGPELASYGWYSRKPTTIEPGLVLHFDEHCAYMYKGYTHPRHRGLRLHAIGMTLALGHYLSAGRKGLVSWVESDNFDSLKSCFRMGYVEFGSIYVAKVFGRFFAYASRGCKAHDFSIGRPAQRDA
jgi:hypothetical protein